jgi:rhamnosyltransferase subunit B
MNFGKRFFEESAAACRLLKCRGVFVSAYGGHMPSGLPPEIHYAPYVAYSQLFPRVRAVVQHGGIGTSSIALAAGVPQLIVPSGHDQYQQAARIAQLGAGDWMWNWQYRGSRIAQKLSRLMGSPEVARACREAAERIQRAPDALELACREIEKLAPRPRISKAG